MKWMQFLTPVKSIDFKETKSMIDDAGSDEVTILDVRQPKEYQQSHIPGSVLIPLPELGDRLGELDPAKPVLVYCAVGGRSRVAAQMLAGKGFNQVYNVAGGIKAWASQTAVGPQDLGVHLFTGKETPEEILKVAFSLEAGLQDFYLDMAEQAGDDGIRSLFERLSGIEVKHQESIVRAYQDLGHPEVTLEALSEAVEEKAMEGGLSTREYLDLYQPDLGSRTDVVSLAMSIEAQALDLYQRVGGRLASGTAKAVILKIADEEGDHLASLARLMDSL